MRRSLELSRWFVGLMGTRQAELAAAALADADARVHAAVNGLPIVVFEFDANGIYTCLAGDMVRLFGITPELLVGRSIFDFPKFVPGKNVMVRRALAGETVSFDGLWPRGRFTIRLVPHLDAEGRVTRVIALGYETMPRKAADPHFERLLEALAQSEARFRAMCDCAPLGICVSNPELELGYVNSALCSLLDRQPAELLGCSWGSLIHHEERELARLAWENNRADSLHGALRLLRRDGSTVWTSVRMAAMHDDGELLGYVAVVADISQERAAREATERAQRDLRSVIESSPEGIAVVRDQRWIFLNRALVTTLGYSDAHELLGCDASDIVHPEDRARALELIASTWPPALDGAPRELRYRCANGEYALLSLRAAALTEFEGSPALLLSARDITEHKKLQARLLVTERLLSVGTLAAGIAHEINNPLAAVLSNLDWLSRQLTGLQARLDSGAQPELPELQQALAALSKPIEDARDAGWRVRAIVHDLKLFSRADEEALRPVELAAVLDSAVRMAGNELRHRARVVREYHDVPHARGSEGRLGQVFLNLLINATQAIPEGCADQHEVRLIVRPSSEGRVCVEIRDSGSGIEESLLDRIFDPFFTTKPGVGTGLGLSICQRLVTSMGGTIEVDSQPGRGSTFRVTLHGSDADETSAAPPSQPPSAAVSGRGRVLVIDDDPAVGAALELLLSEEHEVEVVTSARGALERIHSGTGYDAILCDVMMPEMSGIELHGELVQTHPELAAQIVFLTGGAFTLRAREFLDRVDNPWLSKPFEPQSLRALIGRCLSRSSPAT